QAGDEAVDPGLKEITVTFSKDMMTNKMWAVVQVSKDNFPPSAGQIHYMSDGRTCVVPVKLEPARPTSYGSIAGNTTVFEIRTTIPQCPINSHSQRRSEHHDDS